MKKIIYKIILILLIALPITSLAFLEHVITEGTTESIQGIVQLRGSLKASSGDFLRVNFYYSETPSSNCLNMVNFGGTVTSPTELVGKGFKQNFTQSIGNLKTDTRYYFCAVGTDVFGSVTKFGEVLSFLTKPPSSPIPPSTGGRTSPRAPLIITPDKIGKVSTIDVTSANDVSAILEGSVDRIEAESFGYFRYSTLEKPPVFCNDIYGSQMRSATATEPYINGKVLKGNFTATVNELLPDTTYYYCAIVSNNAKNPTEIEYGQVKKFHTAPCQTCDKTTIRTFPAINILSRSATVRGQYSTTEQIVTYFEYKKSGTGIPWQKTTETLRGAKSYGNINSTLGNLDPDTVYSFRAVAETPSTGDKEKKSFYGNVYTFRTNSALSIFRPDVWRPDGDAGVPNNGGRELPGDEPCSPDNRDNPCPDDGTGTCFDRIKNGNETGIDTGGRCSRVLPPPDFPCNPDDVNNPCPDDGTCYDFIQNGNETGVDRGGRCAIPPLPHCYDGIKNGNETGIDVGGDCGDNPFDQGSCYDGIQNGNETGVDEGGRCSFGFYNGFSIELNGININGISIGGITLCSQVDPNGPITCVMNGGITTGGFDGSGVGFGGTIFGGVTTGGKPTGCTLVLNKPINGCTLKGVNKGGVRTNKKIGQKGTPPNDAIVRYHEGVETVFTRQIKRNTNLAQNYRDVDDTDLQYFADTVSHFMAIDFAYVDPNTGREIRVSTPDVSAYELQQIGSTLLVYEYYKDRIIDIRSTTTIFKTKNPYEYYYKKVRRFFGF